MSFESEHGIKNRGKEAIASFHEKKLKTGDRISGVKRPKKSMKEAIARKMAK